MDDEVKNKDVLIETNRKLQKTVQQLLIVQKDHQHLVKEIKIKNSKLEKALKKISKQSVELIESAKMASLGIFAGGVAHELNNPLMAILNYAQFCLKHTPVEERVYKVLKDIETETKRCMEVVKAVLTFSRLTEEGKENFEEFDFLIIVKRILELLDYRIEQEHVEVVLDFPKDGLIVFIKQNMMQRAFLNIFLNALDAVRQTTLKKITITGEYKNEHAIISITDTGCGIEEQNKPKLFTPFFTTKQAGTSVGMGLAITKQIINEHRGEISVISEVNVGTTFTILLPLKETTI
ncbi:MAG: HAMP domain-containing sensor histidine kinase [Gammaproteobacteria bacterium]|jgi:two-component system NtrC family sensor kinase